MLSGDGEEHFEEEKGEITEQDTLDMKNNLSGRGSQSVLSLADSGSNFEEHIGDEDEGDDVEMDRVNEEIEQARLYGGYMFGRRRNDNFKLPETVSILHWPFPIPEAPEGESPRDWAEVFSAAEVVLVGTAHFSKSSQEDVQKTIEALQPDIVLVELCPSRVSILNLDEETLFREAKDMSTAKLIQLMKSGGPLHGIMYTLLISMSAHVTRQLGMAPGGEFRVAFRTSQTVPYCQFVLGDRPIEVTLGRALGSLSVWQKIKFFFHLLSSHSMKITPEDVEKCKQSDVLEQLLEEMAGDFPQLSQIFVEERDKYMTAALHNLMLTQTLRKRAAYQHTDGLEWQPLRIVGVVGIGHKPGIISGWSTHHDIGTLIQIPKPSTTSVVVSTAIRWSVYGIAAVLLFRAGRGIVRRLGTTF